MSQPTAYKLNHQIQILHDTSDGTGTPNFQPIFQKIYAAKQGLSEKIYYASAAQQGEDAATFIIHYSPNYASQIKATMQLVDNGDIDHPYEIQGPPVDIYDDRKWLKIHAKRNDMNGG